MISEDVEIAVVGAGLAGIATAYYLCLQRRAPWLVIVDPRPPMSLTSAQSGENYRNWWPHRTMAAFSNRSIDLMERIARESGNVLAMTRRGYALATRKADIDTLIDQLHDGFPTAGPDSIRVHERGSSGSYRPALSADWQSAPDGVDVLRDRALIRQAFPSFDPAVANVLHIRRAGDISGQQLGEYMLERIRARGGSLLSARVRAIEPGSRFTLVLAGADGGGRIRADRLVNAAGPFAQEIAAMLGLELPVSNVLQQKIAFEDRAGSIPRRMPFAIDLDERSLDWTHEERTLLAEDPETAWLAGVLPGGIHCRPVGGDRGRWVKLGWAYNRAAAQPREGPHEDPELDSRFPEIVLRGAAGLNPALKGIYGTLPRGFSHYGGYYTMTPENWPLIGPMATDGAFVVGALSGFGTMAACAAGELGAAWIAEQGLPDYAPHLGLARYRDKALMAELEGAASRGVL